MTILPFSVGDRVMWHGWAASIVAVRGERIALRRDGEGFDILTTVDILRQHQPPRLSGHDWLATAVIDVTAPVTPPADCAP